MPLILDGTKGGTFPSWTTAGRPASPTAGQTGFNTTLSVLETYSGTAWVPNGARVLLGTYTASVAAQLDLTSWYSSAFDLYEIEMIDVVASSNNDDLRCRVSTNNGSTFDTASNYAWNIVYGTASGAAGANGESAAYIGLGGGRGNSAGIASSGTIKLSNPGGAYHKVITSVSAIYQTSTTPSMAMTLSGGVWKSTSAYNAIRFYMGTGNISATARIYGVGK
jgi:hypothetical protein